MSSLVAELLSAHLEPKRPHLAHARRAVKGVASGREAWERLQAEGLVPPGERLFRVTARELARSGHRTESLRRINLTHLASGARSLALPHPGTAGAAVAYASVDGLDRAERHAREYLLRLQPFRFLLAHDPPLGARTPVWRMLGSPIGLPESGPDLCDVEGAYPLATLASRLSATALPSHPLRFAAAGLHATAAEMWARAERPLPAQLSVSNQLFFFPQPMIRTRLAQFPNPFEPLVEIWRLGFGIRRLSQETILLYLPHAAPPADIERNRTRVSFSVEEELRRSAEQADAPRVFELLGSGVDPNAEDSYGRTALELAVGAGFRTQAAMLSALLDAGADPTHETESGTSCLAIAIARDERRLSHALLDLGLDMHQRLGGGTSLLHVAARVGSARMIDLLVARGLDPKLQCLRGRTPLHEAAASRSSFAHEAVRALLDRGADPNARDRFGWTPLHQAAINDLGGMGIADVLIERGAKALPDRGGRLPAELARLEVLVKAMARAPRGVATPLDPVSAPARNHVLEAAIAAAPDDRAAWSVYADWLASKNDPHAELIQVGLAAEAQRGDERRRLRRAARRIAQDRQFELLGELQRILPTVAVRPHPELGFEHGFLTSLDFRGSITSLRALLTADASRFLRRLFVSGAQNVLRLLAGLGSQSLAALTLFDCAAPLELELARALPRVRRLQLTSLLPRSIAWPGLEELAFVAHGPPSIDPGLAYPELPDLIRLRIVAQQDGARLSVQPLARALLPKLTALVFKGTAELFRELAHAQWFSRIERLDLLQADVETVARLEQIARERLNLRRIRVVAPHLSTEAKRQLASRLKVLIPRVRVS